MYVNVEDANSSNTVPARFVLRSRRRSRPARVVSHAGIIANKPSSPSRPDCAVGDRAAIIRFDLEDSSVRPGQAWQEARAPDPGRYDRPGRPVNRFPYDSMIRIGRPSRRTRKFPVRAAAGRRRLRAARCPAERRPVDVGGIGGADHRQAAGLLGEASADLPIARGARCTRTQDPTTMRWSYGSESGELGGGLLRGDIAHPRAPRRSSRGGARPAIRRETSSGASCAQAGPTARGRRPRARARRTARAGRTAQRSSRPLNRCPGAVSRHQRPSG